jgi:glycosyltransferase involved in cell wall biosynthesis
MSAMTEKAIRILTNMRRLNQSHALGTPLSFHYVGSLGKPAGAIEFVKQCLRADLVVLDAEIKNLMLASTLKFLLPFLPLRIVSLDLILRTPKSSFGRFQAFLKRLLLKNVDRFLLYFKNLDGCERYYGIGRDRAVYVPFKVNGWEQINARPRGTADGDYVLCAGRTLRDIQTFVEAMQSAECPGVLLQQKRELLTAHGTAAWSGELPPNVQVVTDESDRIEDYLDFISQARLVVIPRFKNDIAPSGISTYLVAMALNKCVIISEGPGAEDVLTDQAVIVPPEDVHSLAEQIKQLWHDDNLRSEIAVRGYDYAVSLGGYDRLLADVLRASLQNLADSNVPRRTNYGREAETSH